MALLAFAHTDEFMGFEICPDNLLHYLDLLSLYRKAMVPDAIKEMGKTSEWEQLRSG